MIQPNPYHAASPINAKLAPETISENCVLQDAHQRNGEIDPERNSERQQARCRANRCDDQRSASAFTSVYNAMEGRWCNQQTDAAQYKQQSNGIADLGLRRQGIEPLLEGAVKLEAEQYLRAEHQRARFVKGRLYLAVERHRQPISAGVIVLRLLIQHLGDGRRHWPSLPHGVCQLLTADGPFLGQ